MAGRLGRLAAAAPSAEGREEFDADRIEPVEGAILATESPGGKSRSRAGVLDTATNSRRPVRSGFLRGVGGERGATFPLTPRLNAKKP
jgi:hypothetical protein